jgi:BirA family biotin operon repressor/biotin-[acetyl-CoA-carboxylase] ligase
MDTLFVGKNNIFLAETESTNSYATHLLNTVKLPEGTVVRTDHQTGGKGQRGSVWDAHPSSNLTFSIILFPSFLPLKNQFLLYVVTALACYDTTAEILGESQFDIRIKWPNDILVNRKKIAGILIQNKLMHSVIQSTVIGVGLNVNQESFIFPQAVSFKNLTGVDHGLDQTLAIFCGHLESHYLGLKNKNYQQLNSLYHERLFGMNSKVLVSMNGDEVERIVRGIGDTGLLMLEDMKGRRSQHDVKQLKWLL